MHENPPSIRKGHLILIQQVEAAHVIMDIGSALYRARYLPALESPPRCRLQPGDCLLVLQVNSQALTLMTMTERIDRRVGVGDGCQYTFYEYQSVSQQG